jgi:hypothetical protein
MEHLHGRNRWTTYGGFGLVGYVLGPVTPYLRFERIASTGGSDPFLVPDPLAVPLASFDTVQSVVGLRVDLSDWTALKAEYQNTRFLDRSETTHLAILNWSWGF